MVPLSLMQDGEYVKIICIYRLLNSSLDGRCSAGSNLYGALRKSCCGVP